VFLIDNTKLIVDSTPCLLKSIGCLRISINRGLVVILLTFNLPQSLLICMKQVPKLHYQILYPKRGVQPKKKDED